MGKRVNIKYDPYIHIYAPGYPNISGRRTVPEHRLIVEKNMGKFLKKGEVVHHINGNKKDNRLKNLKVLTRKQHSKLHLNAVKKIKPLEREIKRLKQILNDNNILY